MQIFHTGEHGAFAKTAIQADDLILNGIAAFYRFSRIKETAVADAADKHRIKALPPILGNGKAIGTQFVFPQFTIAKQGMQIRFRKINAKNSKYRTV
jgi:hypothetical protein